MELYKSIDTKGRYPGSLGDAKTYRRTIKALPQYDVAGIYDKWYTYVKNINWTTSHNQKLYKECCNTGRLLYNSGCAGY